jgi:uncharacterized protein (TIGR02646 family)
MRYVDPVDVEVCLPDDWAEVVRKAEEFVERAVAKAMNEARTKGKAEANLNEVTKQARTRAISKKNSIWSKAGQCLREIMHGKCWYCETFEIRSDMPVDHFRPKNSVAECDGNHPGYWWLAFQWKNYRFSCTYCNSARDSEDSKGGKQDHFPLVDPSMRAWNKDEDHLKEIPELLDPCDPDDPSLLFFNDQGRPVANPASATVDAQRRVKSSVRIYHLDHPRLNRERKRIAIKIREKVQLIIRLDAQSILTPGEIELRKDALREIVRHVRGSAAFCTSARCTLSGFRDLPWVEQMMERNY